MTARSNVTPLNSMYVFVLNSIYKGTNLKIVTAMCSQLLLLVSLHFSSPLQHTGSNTGVVHCKVVWSAGLW